jgi:adenylosuccinate synthase
MSKAVVVVGAQWGDEGKGKITNYLSEQADVVVRYQGGDNAGHTIKFSGTTYKLHLIPSGIFNPHIINIMGNGMVINPKSLVEELGQLKVQGFNCDNLYISDRAHVIMDYHRTLDGLNETRLGANQIGTTKRGIGPAYTDKMARIGIRMADFVSDDFYATLKKVLPVKNKELISQGGEALDLVKVYSDYMEIADIIKPYVCDTITLLNSQFAQDKKILFEGAQGSLLDVDFGTYPYVTSSNSTSCGVCSGSGVGPTKINEIIGIFKAYTTRVGSGAFPTEITDEVATYIRETGNEYGTTTKRPRRIGWFDGVAAKYSGQINGFTGVCVMLLDVLSTVETLRIATGYILDNQIIKTVPPRIEDFERCKPTYLEMDGWTENLSNVKTYEELPENAKKYLDKLEEIIGVPIVMFSVGPDRTQTIVRKEVF